MSIITLQDIIDCHRAEDLFGLNPELSLEELKEQFRSLAVLTHPDKNDNSVISNHAFAKLNHFYKEAKYKITVGKYGSPAALLTVESLHKYEVLAEFEDTLFGNVYSCLIDGKASGLFVVSKEPKLNTYLVIERDNLFKLSVAPAYKRQLPELIESFTYNEEGTYRQVNVFAANQEFVTLQDVIDANPNGIDPKDMAWMYRRLLDVLGYAHQGVKIMHGSITPENVLIGLNDTHEVRLINWYTDHSSPGSRQSFIDPRYKNYYPEEVMKKEEYTYSSDIYMATKCMENLLQGMIPKPIQGFFQACTLQKPSYRLQDAWQVRKEFTVLIEKMWGERKFRPLTLQQKEAN
jgi:curved DNA-binding protein CbpA